MSWLRNLTKRRWSPAAVTFGFIVTLWFNQGGDRPVTPEDRGWEWVARVAYEPFRFIYRPAHDQELYYGTASAILGRPFPPEYLDRGEVGGAFAPMATRSGRGLQIPYLQVPLEYPPIVLPFLLAPLAVVRSALAYERLFGVEMGACLLGAVALAVGLASRAFGDGALAKRRWWIACALALAEGSISVQRLDPIVAILLVLALRAAYLRKPTAFGIWIGLAGATKILPLLLAPVVLASDRYMWRRDRLAKAVGSAVLVMGAGLLPLVATPESRAVFVYHSRRGLHIESLAGTLYGLACKLWGSPSLVGHTFGSSNFAGTLPDDLAAACGPVTLVAMSITTILVARTPDADNAAGRLRKTTAALIIGAIVLVLGGKVFSPQYLTWLLPLVLILPHPSLERVCLVFGVALALGQLYLRGFYDWLCEQVPVALATLTCRQAALVAVAVLCASELRAAYQRSDGRPQRNSATCSPKMRSIPESSASPTSTRKASPRLKTASAPPSKRRCSATGQLPLAAPSTRARLERSVGRMRSAWSRIAIDRVSDRTASVSGETSFKRSVGSRGPSSASLSSSPRCGKLTLPLTSTGSPAARIAAYCSMSFPRIFTATRPVRSSRSKNATLPPPSLKTRSR